MAFFTTALGLYGGVLWSGELQGGGPASSRDSFYIKRCLSTRYPHTTTASDPPQRPPRPPP
jgi:hypothetical protein